MASYLIRRVITAIIVLIGVVLITFVMLHVIAPSPGRVVLGLRATLVQVNNYNFTHGYDRPIVVQFLSYLNQVIHGNLGYSYKLNQSVVDLLREKAPLSAFVSGTSLVLAVVIAIPLGIFQAVRRNSIGDNVATIVSFTLYSMPVFLLGLILIDIFALRLGWLNANVGQDQSLGGALANGTDLILPIATLVFINVANYSRYQRSSALDVCAQDYLKVVRAKGLPERLVLLRHLVRNASLPLVTLVGLSIPFLLAGNLLTESVFNINGLGLLFFNSLLNEDYNVLIGYTLIGAFLTVVGNLVADIALTVADPRIRLV
jgi:peptide/nickel transport system permease protein